MTTTTAPAAAGRTIETTASPRHRRIIVWASAGAVLMAVAGGTAGYLALRTDQPEQAAVLSQPPTGSGAPGFGASTGALIGHGTAVVIVPETASGPGGAGTATGALVGHGGSVRG